MPVAVCIATRFINSDLFGSLAELALCSTPVGRKKTNVRWLLKKCYFLSLWQEPQSPQNLLSCTQKEGVRMQLLVSAFGPQSPTLSPVLLIQKGIQGFPLWHQALLSALVSSQCPMIPSLAHLPSTSFPGSKPCSAFSRKNPIINIFLSYSFQQLCIFTVVLPKKKVRLTEVK